MNEKTTPARKFKWASELGTAAPPAGTRWLTISQYSAAMQISESTARRLMQTGLLRFERLGRLVRIPIEALDARPEPSGAIRAGREVLTRG